jgi:hypothetical protein
MSFMSCLTGLGSAGISVPTSQMGFGPTGLGNVNGLAYHILLNASCSC